MAITSPSASAVVHNIYEVFIKMMSDSQSFQEDISAHVMHYVCCHILLALIQKKAQY